MGRDKKKKKRRVELGWMDFDENKLRQTMVEDQDVTIDKNKTLVEINEMAQDLFFPSGSS